MPKYTGGVRDDGVVNNIAPNIIIPGVNDTVSNLQYLPYYYKDMESKHSEDFFNEEGKYIIHKSSLNDPRSGNRAYTITYYTQAATGYTKPNGRTRYLALNHVRVYVSNGQIKLDTHSHTHYNTFHQALLGSLQMFVPPFGNMLWPYTSHPVNPIPVAPQPQPNAVRMQPLLAQPNAVRMGSLPTAAAASSPMMAALLSRPEQLISSAAAPHRINRVLPKQLIALFDFDGTLTLTNGKQTCEWSDPPKLHQKLFPDGWRNTNINKINSPQFEQIKNYYNYYINSNSHLKITEGAQKLIRSVLQNPLNKIVIITKNREDYVRIALQYAFNNDPIINRIIIYTVYFTTDGIVGAVEQQAANGSFSMIPLNLPGKKIIMSKSDAVNDYVSRLDHESVEYRHSNVYVFDDNADDFKEMTEAAKNHFGPDHVKGHHMPIPADYDRYFNSLTIQNNDLVVLGEQHRNAAMPGGRRVKRHTRGHKKSRRTRRK
jgi:hypothetical protein